MKKNDIKALRELSTAELQKKLNELQLAFANAQMEKKVNKLQDRRTTSKLSDDIARVKTMLTAKEMES